MPTSSYHISQSISGALRMDPVEFAETFQGCFTTDDGKPMSLIEAKQELERLHSEGWRCIPYGNCDNFDKEMGCQGHEQGKENE